MIRTAIVDYGLGNMRSVRKALEKVGANPVITHEIAEIQSADGIILPGVGAFHEGMTKLADLRSALLEAQGRIPMLGICLGMQMMMDYSEEHGHYAGLGLIPGVVRRFPDTPGCKIPHMGWNQIQRRSEDPLFDGIPDEAYVYFVHSYWADTDPAHTLTSTDYICPFASAIRNETAWGTQFHPEKSGETGLKILKNFTDML